MPRLRRKRKSRAKRRLCTWCRRFFMPTGRGLPNEQICPYCGQKTIISKSISELKKEAWRLFSLIVRHIDRKTGLVVGEQKCVTCTRVLPPEQLDAGHYMSRTYGHTMFSMNNVWPQCKICNGQLTSHREHPDMPLMRDRYTAFLRQEIGDGEPDRLFNLAHQAPAKTWTRDELRGLILKYRDKLGAAGVPH